eukprot:gene10026-7916_t
MNFKRNVTDEQNEKHKRELSKILREPNNRSCVDCGTRNPTWASINLGCIFCLTCSGVHRSLGVHISQVRSCNLDTWLPRQVEFLGTMGNFRANQYWEAKLPAGFHRPPSGNPNPELVSFIRSKYCDRRYAPDGVEPPNIDNYASHAFMQQLAASEPVAAATTTSAQQPGVQPGAAGSRLRHNQHGLVPPQRPAAQVVDLLGDWESSSNTSTTTRAAAAAPQASKASHNQQDPFEWSSFSPRNTANTASSAANPAQRAHQHSMPAPPAPTNAISSTNFSQQRAHQNSMPEPHAPTNAIARTNLSHLHTNQRSFSDPFMTASAAPAPSSASDPFRNMQIAGAASGGSAAMAAGTPATAAWGSSPAAAADPFAGFDDLFAGMSIPCAPTSSQTLPGSLLQNSSSEILLQGQTLAGSLLQNISTGNLLQGQVAPSPQVSVGGGGLASQSSAYTPPGNSAVQLQTSKTADEIMSLFDRPAACGGAIQGSTNSDFEIQGSRVPIRGRHF